MIGAMIGAGLYFVTVVGDRRALHMSRFVLNLFLLLFSISTKIIAILSFR